MAATRMTLDESLKLEITDLYKQARNVDAEVIITETHAKIGDVEVEFDVNIYETLKSLRTKVRNLTIKHDA